jgi:hypothetical protein
MAWQGAIGKVIGGLAKNIGGNKDGSGKTGDIASKAFGAAQLGVGMYQKKKARAALPGAEDLGQRQMLNAIRRRTRAIETGTAGSSDAAINRQNIKSAGINAFKAGGPMNFGILNQLMSGASAASAANRGEQLQSFLQQEKDLVDTMAQRRFDRQMLIQQEDRADAMGNISGGQDNLLASLGKGKKNDTTKGKKNKNNKKNTTDNSYNIA